MRKWIRENIKYFIITYLVVGFCGTVAYVGLTVIDMLGEIL